jgi:hypothetical protein
MLLSRYKLLLLAAAFLIVSCGQKSPYGDYKRTIPDEVQTQPLKVGTNFINAPNNSLTFYVLKKGKSRFSNLTFTAPEKGRLIISKISYGLGMNCVGSDGNNDYNVNYTYWTQSQSSSLFDQQIEPTSGPFGDNDLQDMLLLQAAQEVQIRVELASLTDCSEAEIMLLATFDKGSTDL